MYYFIQNNPISFASVVCRFHNHDVVEEMVFEVDGTFSMVASQILIVGLIFWTHRTSKSCS